MAVLGRNSRAKVPTNMSYMQFQQQCEDCKKTWNAAFGIVGTTYIAQPPEVCPYCGSKNLVKIADEWKTETGILRVVDKEE
jgi:rRNA maturation endonuclease Nob1